LVGREESREEKVQYMEEKRGGKKGYSISKWKREDEVTWKRGEEEKK
jgi:hypothetical protein